MSVRWEILVLIVACSIVTVVPRVLPMLLVNRLKLPEGVIAWLTYIPAAVIAALFFKEMLLEQGSFRSLFSPHMLAGVVALIVAFQTKSIYITCLSGMACFAILEWLFT